MFSFVSKSVALDPEFSKKRTKMYVTGGTKVGNFLFTGVLYQVLKLTYM